MKKRLANGLLQIKVMDNDINFVEQELILIFYEYWKHRSLEMKMFNDLDYHCLSYDMIQEDLPCLDITTKRISEIFIHEFSELPKDHDERYAKASQATKRKIEKYKYLGLFKHKNVMVGNRKKKVYFHPTKRFFDLFGDIDREESSPRYIELRKDGFRASKDHVKMIDEMDEELFLISKDYCIKNDKKSSGYLLRVYNTFLKEKNPSKSANFDGINNNNNLY